jgi:Uma2 family endonuclease
MTTATADKLMTAEEFLALPDDGVERWLIRGQLRENGDSDMTMRNGKHALTESRVVRILGRWLDANPALTSEVASGEAGFLLRQTPATVSAGVDVALVTKEQADLLASSPTTLLTGPPRLIAEVLSPSDSVEDVDERVNEYLDCGVPVVWVLNPYNRTLVVHRPGQETLAHDVRDTLAGDPELPGFSAPVAEFFR